MSQNVPVAEIMACFTGVLVCADAATIGALPSPDSLENRPRATPYLAVIIIDMPAIAPPAAEGLKAESIISPMDDARFS